MVWKGVLINVAETFEQIDSVWADQLTTYAWLSGEEVGSTDWVVGIDQLVWRDSASGRVMRVAAHRARVSAEWQRLLLERYKRMWEVVTSDHLFRSLSFAESKAREEILRLSSQDDEMQRMMKE